MWSILTANDVASDVQLCFAADVFWQENTKVETQLLKIFSNVYNVGTPCWSDKFNVYLCLNQDENRCRVHL